MKDFNRFAHSGVKKDLRYLVNRLRSMGRFEFGSSGDGEVTVHGKDHTAYARTYKSKDGWRLVLCRGSQILETTFPQSPEQVSCIARKVR